MKLSSNIFYPLSLQAHGHLVMQNTFNLTSKVPISVSRESLQSKNNLHIQIHNSKHSMPKKNGAEHRKTSLKPDLDKDHHMKSNPGKKDKYIMLSHILNQN